MTKKGKYAYHLGFNNPYAIKNNPDRNLCYFSDLLLKIIKEWRTLSLYPAID